jgi:hypothetical protein
MLACTTAEHAHVISIHCCSTGSAILPSAPILLLASSQLAGQLAFEGVQCIAAECMVRWSEYTSRWDEAVQTCTSCGTYA